MAYKLDNRLICDIYARCKRLFAYEGFTYRSKNDCPEEVQERVVTKLYSELETNYDVASELGVSPAVVDSIKRRPYKVARHFWKKLDDIMLESSIQRVSNNADPRRLPTYKINWKHVENEMVTCGYNLSVRQLYRRWHKLNNSMVGLRDSTLTQELQGSAHVIPPSP